MKFIFDIFLILLMILIVFINTKRGFIRSVWSSVTLIGSFAIAYAFGPMIGQFLFMDFILDSLIEYVIGVLNNMLTTAQEGCDLSEMFASFSNELVAMSNNLGVTLESLQEQFLEVSVSQEQLYNIANSVALPLSRTISSAAGIIAVFLLSVIILSILGFVIKIITKISIIKALDRALGFALGLIEAMIVLCIFCVIAAVCMELGFLNTELASYFAALTDNSIIFRLFNAFSPIDFINVG